MAFRREVIEQLVNTYPKLCGTEPTSYIIQNFDGSKYYKGLLEVCHASLRYPDKTGFEELITATPNGISYIKALIDGPFHQWKEYIELVQLTDTEYYYLHIKNLDLIPSKVVYNLCIASRAPIEFPAVVSRWDDLIKGGIHPSVALCVSARELRDNKMTQINAPYSGHWWFQSDHDWRTIIQGTPTKLKDCPSFSASPYSSAPTNCIWGKGDPIELKGYLSVTVDELDKQFRKELKL